MASLTYAKAGVDIKKADLLVSRIGGWAKSTLNSKVESSVGGYASLYRLDAQRLIAASTDGVGTKLKLAFESGRHDTVGIDLVAMSVNDLLCVGAKPAFFLDYFATGGLSLKVASSVIQGVAQGCELARCALVGGETAEMPGLYQKGEYDLAGFAVGLVDSKNLLPKKTLRPGDVLIGVGSSGFHSNGFSLLRRLLPKVGGERKRLIRELLTPTRIYSRSVESILTTGKVLGLAHITGSGFLNIPRLSESVSYEVKLPPQSALPSILAWGRKRSGLSLKEWTTTFNAGVGLVVAARPADESLLMARLKKSGESVFRLGQIIRRRSGHHSEVHVMDATGECAVLDYGD